MTADILHMATALTDSESHASNRLVKAVLQVGILVVFVPLGILAGWLNQSPSSQVLVKRAASGADHAALLELVHRSTRYQHAADHLQNLLVQDSAALHALAHLAAGNEEALIYLISMSRNRPEALNFLADVELSYHFALELLHHMAPEGMEELTRKAQTHANACFMLGVAYEQGCHVEQDWERSA